MDSGSSDAGRPRWRSVACLAACAALLGAGVGCDDDQGSAEQDEPATPPTLTGEERRLLTTYDRRIEAHCVRVARSLLEPQAAPTALQSERAYAAADALIALAAEKPSAPLGAGQDTRLFLADVLENLDGSNCDPGMVGRLEQGLAQIPPAQ